MAGGGGGGGGLMMAHPAGNAVGRAGAPQPPPQASSTHGGAPPPSAAFLGADLLDKQQSISLKQVKHTAHLPIVAVDLYAGEPHVAMYPPKPEDPSIGTPPVLVGKMKADVAFQSTETAQKTLRKWLAKQKTYTSLQTDALAKNDDAAAVLIKKPQQWLGLRRLEDAPEFVRSRVTTELATPAISQETSLDVGTTMANSTLDGSQPTGDDFDRVVCNVRIHSSKKVLTVLPEEATQILLNQAQHHVATKSNLGDDEDEIADCPMAVAIPAYASHDAAVEALYDATGSSGVFFQRSVCALSGALLPGPEGKPNKLLERLNEVRTAMHKEFQREQAKNPGATFEDEILLILLGMTDEGFECTAVQVSTLQPSNLCCLYGDFKVLSTVSYQAENPLTKIRQCSTELEAAIDQLAPEADGPGGLVIYGSKAEQVSIAAKWNAIKLKQKEWADVPVFNTNPDCVAIGTAILGAVSHGRLSVLVDAGAKKKAALGIRVQNVAPAAVGVQINYFGGAAEKWEPVKVIFDFDRRIPAGPYAIDLKAADCVISRSGISTTPDEAFEKAYKEVQGAKGIPRREEAALNLKIQVVQKWARDGEWINVGDPMEPLVKLEGDVGEEEKRVACESVSLKLSLGVSGMIATRLDGEL
jgi:hypothetical protein